MTPAERGGGRASAILVLATVFLCGGVLLGVEMAASRVLAPYFGNSAGSRRATGSAARSATASRRP